MKNYRILIFLSILLLILPLPFSYILDLLSNLDFFPTFSRHRFYEEYFKMLGTFVTMIIGFWFANKLIEKRNLIFRLSEIEIFRNLLKLFRSSVNELDKINKKREFIRLQEVKFTFESLYDQLFRIYSISFHVRNSLSKHGFELFKDIERLKREIFTQISTDPINDKSVGDMIGILERLEKEV
ncbi:MAG: hypothetical protein ACFFG0_42735 [Candidatus Thorarchaeota archaeon]